MKTPEGCRGRVAPAKQFLTSKHKTMSQPTNKVLTITEKNGKFIAELALPHVFIAFPITEKGMEQILDDVHGAITKIHEEREALENSN